MLFVGSGYIRKCFRISSESAATPTTQNAYAGYLMNHLKERSLQPQVGTQRDAAPAASAVARSTHDCGNEHVEVERAGDVQRRPTPAARPVTAPRCGSGRWCSYPCRATFSCFSIVRLT
ncbi:hypothetical protein EVAR_36357_1 [Eumeta japonica]|uniref:Uncharacterized protein n=1 Tax=Eumeta variegata TaxID=151549 RepID=A0A4C1W4X0_EUMVA|nr:hypothetical protein EVAR_36357_1 [Eumeta japonica]